LWRTDEGNGDQDFEICADHRQILRERCHAGKRVRKGVAGAYAVQLNTATCPEVIFDESLALTIGRIGRNHCVPKALVNRPVICVPLDLL
jgi:hypothetical protein